VRSRVGNRWLDRWPFGVAKNLRWAEFADIGAHASGPRSPVVSQDGFTSRSGHSLLDVMCQEQRLRPG
jgi:hypothetical protein